MPPRRLKPGQGFSLFDLKDTLSDVTDTLTSALTKQGVDVNQDQLFLRLQGLMQDINLTNNSSDYAFDRPMVASDNVPYSVAGDMLVIAYEHFKNNDKTDAVKMLLTAMESDDFGAIANGLFLMNKKHEVNLLADDSTDNDDVEDSDIDDEGEGDEDEDNTDDSDDDTSNEDDDDSDEDELSDEDIDALVKDHESTAEDDVEEDSEDSKEDNKKEESKSKESKSADVKTEAKVTEKTTEKVVETKPKPMGKTSSEMVASHTAKVLANKLSMDGSSINRAKAREFLKTNPNL